MPFAGSPCSNSTVGIWGLGVQDFPDMYWPLCTAPICTAPPMELWKHPAQQQL